MVWERVFSAGVIRGIFLVPLCSDATEMLTPSFLIWGRKKRSITEYLLLLLQTKINILVSTHWVALPRNFLVNVHLWETKWKNWDWRVEEGGEFLGYLAIACVLRGRSLYLNSLVVCVVFWFFFGIFLPFIMAPRHKLDSSHFQNETDFNRVVGLNGVVNFKAALVTICCRCWKNSRGTNSQTDPNMTSVSFSLLNNSSP